MVLVAIMVEELLQLKLLDLLLAAPGVNVAEDLDVPGVEAELFHLLVRDD